MKGPLMDLPWVGTAPVTHVLLINTAGNMEMRFITKKKQWRRQATFRSSVDMPLLDYSSPVV